MKKHVGFTLLETVISIFIITVIFTTVSSMGAMKDNIENDIEHDFDMYEIENILVLSKAACRKNDLTGYISINPEKDKLGFYCDVSSSCFRDIKLSPSSDCIGENTNLYLSSKGKIKSGSTIYVKCDGRIESITIGVGIDTIRIKE